MCEVNHYIKSFNLFFHVLTLYLFFYLMLNETFVLNNS